MTKEKILEARRQTYRRNGDRFVRITSEGCVMDTDMHMLKPVESHRVSVCGEIQIKKFQPLDIDGLKYLADVVTGTLYDSATGRCGSSHMHILQEDA